MCIETCKSCFLCFLFQLSHQLLFSVFRSYVHILTCGAKRFSAQFCQPVLDNFKVGAYRFELSRPKNIRTQIRKTHRQKMPQIKAYCSQKTETNTMQRIHKLPTVKQHHCKQTSVNLNFLTNETTVFVFIVDTRIALFAFEHSHSSD